MQSDVAKLPDSSSNPQNEDYFLEVVAIAYLELLFFSPLIFLERGWKNDPSLGWNGAGKM